MNFQWILLAILAVSLISEIAKAITRPMLKNVLRLICVPVAFLITFIIQVCGLFQMLAEKATGLLLDYVMPMLASRLPIPIESMDGVIKFLTAFCSTVLSPVLFITVFSVLLFLLRSIHVNLLLKFINNRKIKKEKNELKAQIKVEKAAVKQLIHENEEKLQDALAVALKDNDTAMETFLEEYEAPDEDTIEDMIEERVKNEKKNKKKSGYYKESYERKTMSLACGAVSGFLILAVTLMPMFYGMSVLSAVTDGIRNTDADDTKVYQVINVVDEHIVTPYETSFVVQLYDSMALIDLMNSTVRAGGKMVFDDGQVVYVDDSIKRLLTHGVSAAAEITSGKSEQKNLANDIGSLVSDPIIVDILADVLVAYVDKMEVKEPADGDIASSILAELVNHYKTVDKSVIKSDIGAISDTAVVAIQNGIFTDALSGDINIEKLLTDKEMLGELLVSMSGLSVYPPLMENVFTMGIEMVVPMLNLPEETVVEMKDSFAFENWTDDSIKKADSEKLMAIVFGLFDIMDAMGNSEGGETDSLALLDQFVTLGKLLDLMTETKCVPELAPILFKAIVTNEMFGGIITEEMADSINAEIANTDHTYEEYMTSLAALLKMALGSMSK